ncbi:unnamed protein product [Penicillium salamii]|nr:unnamed protein product [Penicillium salamii]
MPISKKTSISASKPLASAHTPMSQRASPVSGDKTSGRMHKRSRSGCYTCRLRRKKCDENHPTCGACANLQVQCNYKRPDWWTDAALRRGRKEHIKNTIKQTKMRERNGNHPNHLNRHRNMSGAMPTSPVNEYGGPMCNEPYDMFTSQLPTPGLGNAPYGPYAPSYEVDVRTERQTFVNDVPMRHDSSTSTFSAFAPPQLSAPMPTFAGDEWFGDEYFAQAGGYNGFNQDVAVDPTMDKTNSLLQSNIAVSEHDRPLLDHFIHNVLRQIFPVLEAHGKGNLRAKAILRALETNKCYLHCCLSVASIHLKTTEGLEGEQIDHDIMRHRYEAISQLCQALGEDINHEEILDATLAMIFFHCSVGPADDYLPDIPWFDHFQAASNLVTRLDLPTALIQDSYGALATPFSMSLTSWIDILGATMVGKTPQFAHQYRSKYLSQTMSGLRELMGCDDKVMYLISEITCLDSLKSEGRIDGMAVCCHVQLLGQQLKSTEPADPTLESPYHPATGAIQPEILTKTISHIFRLAARIYLCSLVPGFDRSQESNESLIAAVTNALQFIPAGPYGYDRSLVWPLLMTGVFSGPSSPFRAVLANRTAALGDYGDLGSFGRMYRLLQEVWRMTDDPISSSQVSPGDKSHNSSLTSPISKLEGSESPSGAGATMGGREIKRQQAHWRDIMKRNNWNYLLI